MTEQHGGGLSVRAFISVPIGASLSRSLGRKQEELASCGSDTRWVAPENIHLTLVFLGDVSLETARRIGAGLDRAAAGGERFTLEVSGIGFFGRPSAPRVIWAGLKGDLDKIRSMHQKAQQASAAANLRVEDRPFSPHLTLGRTKSGRNVKSLLAAIEAGQHTSFGSLVVEGYFLMKSVLTPRGPEYSILHEAVFAAARPDERIS